MITLIINWYENKNSYENFLLSNQHIKFWQNLKFIFNVKYKNAILSENPD